MKCLLYMKFKTLLYCVGGAIVFLLLLQVLIQVYDEFFSASQKHWMRGISIQHEPNKSGSISDVEDLVVLWWTPFTGQKGVVRQCGSARCFFTEDRRLRNHTLTKAIMFYGSNINVIDLPLPRNSLVWDWALLHEESPKNTPALSHLEALELFNFSATFSRRSNFPLTLQYLKNTDVLTDMKYFIPLEQKEKLLSELAPVIYVHSDCGTPLERDAYATELMKYIPVDSYGKCVQNKQLPEHLSDPMENMDSDEFMHFVARYKFTLSFENAICEDYITEKLWRPLIVGSVPIYMGSPSVRDWLPNNDSVILATDFKSPKALAEYLHYLNTDTNKYREFLKHKLGRSNERITNKRLTSAIEERKWGIDNDFEKGNFIEHFECFVCEQEHKKLNGETTHFPPVTRDHYNCPVPVSPLTRKENKLNWWVDQWQMGRCEARVLRKYVELGMTKYTREEFYDDLRKMLTKKLC